MMNINIGAGALAVILAMGSTGSASAQIGHTVAITGALSNPAAHGTKVNMKGEIKGYGGYGYMTVMKVTLVSNTCERNS
jgi:hypothetical protein